MTAYFRSVGTFAATIFMMAFIGIEREQHQRRAQSPGKSEPRAKLRQ